VNSAQEAQTTAVDRTTILPIRHSRVFFSVDAINAAVAQSQAQRSRRTSGSSDGVDGEVIDDEDDDGT